MPIAHWWWELQARTEQAKSTEATGKFQGPEWDEARRKHREKMNGKSSVTSG